MNDTVSNIEKPLLINFKFCGKKRTRQKKKKNNNLVIQEQTA
jgi:hypothetical protein